MRILLHLLMKFTITFEHKILFTTPLSLVKITTTKEIINCVKKKFS